MIHKIYFDVFIDKNIRNNQDADKYRGEKGGFRLPSQTFKTWTVVDDKK